MRKKFDFFYWFESDFRGATVGLEPEARMLYRELICFAMVEGYFPSDPVMVRRITGISLKNAKRWMADILAHVPSLFEIEPGKMTHPKIEKNRAAIIAGVEKKKLKNQKQYEEVQQRLAQEQNDAPPPKPTKPKVKPPAPVQVAAVEPAPAPSPLADPKKHPLHGDWVRLFNLFPKNPSMTFGLADRNKWVSACTRVILTPEDVASLQVAIEIYAAETDKKFLMYPRNFVINEKKNGEQPWRGFTADVKAEVDGVAQSAKSLRFVRVPWRDYDSGTAADQAQWAAQWPDGDRRQWVAEQLAKVPAARHVEWCDRQQLQEYAPAA